MKRNMHLDIDGGKVTLMAGSDLNQIIDKQGVRSTAGEQWLKEEEK